MCPRLLRSPRPSALRCPAVRSEHRSRPHQTGAYLTPRRSCSAQAPATCPHPLQVVDRAMGSHLSLGTMASCSLSARPDRQGAPRGGRGPGRSTWWPARRSSELRACSPRRGKALHPGHFRWPLRLARSPLMDQTKGRKAAAGVTEVRNENPPNTKAKVRLRKPL